jgi:hypothetical protein
MITIMLLMFELTYNVFFGHGEDVFSSSSSSSSSSLRGLHFHVWVVAVNPWFVSCISDAFSPSLKQNLMQRCCFFISGIKKS